MNFFVKPFLALLALSLCISCSHNRSRVVEKKSGSDANSGAVTPVEKEKSLVSAIDFEPGRKGLSAEATAEINRALMEAEMSGEVAEVSIAAWSDVEASEGQGQKIPQAQVELAEERAQNIEKYIDRMQPTADLKVHNMAEETQPFIEYLKSQDPKTKSQLAEVGVATDDVSNGIKWRSSAALVLIKLK